MQWVTSLQFVDRHKANVSDVLYESFVACLVAKTWGVSQRFVYRIAKKS
jgi:hypothetical protein